MLNRRLVQPLPKLLRRLSHLIGFEHGLLGRRCLESQAESEVQLELDFSPRPRRRGTAQRGEGAAIVQGRQAP